MSQDNVNELNQASADNKVTEYEVFSPHLEPYLPPIICQTADDADRVCSNLIAVCGMHFGASCGWQVREVVLNERPIPKWAINSTAITVEEGRRLAATHGQDRMVIVGWNALAKGTNIVTIGSNHDHSEAAYNLGKFIAKAVGHAEDGETLEDRRQEHETAVPTPQAE